MRKLHDIKSELLTKQILSTNQMLHVKGGEDLLVDPLLLTEDDKRRARPGGGTSTL